eukprot:7205597-Ditylum_brightwellii.AAC.1
MHGHNRTNNIENCFELNQHMKRTKPNMSQNKVDKISYKDLNAFVNAKRKEKEVELNAFNKFCSLNVESSNEEDEPNKHAPINVDNDNSSSSHLLSDDSDCDIK